MQDGVALLGQHVARFNQGRVAASYAWRKRPGVAAGALMLTLREGRIAQLAVRYGADARQAG